MVWSPSAHSKSLGPLASPPSHSNGLGGSSQTRKSSSCPLSLLASALQPNTSIPESSLGLPPPPTVVSVQAQRQGPSRGQHSQIPLPGKVCPSETLTCWGGHERLPLGSSLHLILSDSPLPISLLSFPWKWLLSQAHSLFTATQVYILAVQQPSGKIPTGPA